MTFKGFKFKKDNHQKWFATTDEAKKTVTVNVKKNKKAGRGELLDTLQHEKEHIIHPHKSEKAIQHLTKITKKKLSKKQKQKLYRM